MNHDEELQNEAELGKLNSEDSIDAKAYREVFNALNTPLAFKLPEGFANKVVARLDKQQQTSLTRDYIWYGAGVFALLAAVAITLYFVPVSADLGFLKSLAPLKWVFVFGAGFIIFLNWIDYRFVRNKTSQQR